MNGLRSDLESGKGGWHHSLKGYVSFAGIFLLFFMVFLSRPAYSGIYVMVDANGVFHFTNVPTSRNYHLFIGDDTRRVPEGGVSPCKVGRIPYESIIHLYAKKYGVDAALIKAMICAESQFNPHAVSKRGALGLMQLMPETAKDLSVRNAMDPEENIRAGIKYLKMLIEKFKGNIPLALAAYNAGPHLISPNGKIPAIRETRSYVKRVLNYYRKYR